MAIGLPGKNGVISGMRSSCEVVVEINMIKAIYSDVPFFISKNKVILSGGIEGGVLPVEYFRSMRDMKKKNFIYSAPIDYICVYDFEC
jgi:2'-phosphotransferase